ncbi:hypothetical protein B0H19DRAFT_70717 [Mycena capillaripes]|nr:hypothetical protein B0H19DRAFT_70717 [Mycena capillaripes]
MDSFLESATKDPSEKASELSHITLIFRDIDEKYIAASLSVKDCQSWQDLLNNLVLTQNTRLHSYVKSGRFVVRLEDDSKALLFEDKWDAWVSGICADPTIQPRVALCVIRDTCCEKPNENENGFCDECGMQFLKDEPSCLWDPPPHTSMVAQLPWRSSSNPIMLEATTASAAPNFAHSADNSVVRRRRLPRQEAQYSYPPSRSSAPLPVEVHHSEALTSVPVGEGIADPAERSARSVGEYLRIIHLFIVAPPFFHDEADDWNLERLDHRLHAFRSWVLTANGGLLAAPAAILALSSISTSPVAQSFVILAGIFAFFGLIYTILLVFHIGDRKTLFLLLLQQDGLDEMKSSSWAASTAMCLPLSWMAWSILSLLFSLITLGVQSLVYTLRRLSSSKDPGGANVSGYPSPNPALFNIFQLGAFTLVIVFSSVHVVMLYIQLRRCRLSSLNLLHRCADELEAGE